MTITINPGTNVDELVESLLRENPMTSIVYEVIDNELHYEVHPHQMMVVS